MAVSIHIDVRRRAQQHGNDTYGYVVEVSTDGAGFDTKYFCPLQSDGTMDDARREAEWIARVYADGCRYAGADVRVTSGGYGI